MGHHITAVIGRPDTVGAVADAAGCPPLTRLPGGWEIVPLGHEQLDALSGADFEICAEGFTHLSTALEQTLAEASRAGVLIYLETEYFGGVGVQAAALFRDRRIIWRRSESSSHRSPKDDSPINSGLRELGVEAAGGLDEFDTIGLSEFRSLEALGLDE
jgi:hypothetical protein